MATPNKTKARKGIAPKNTKANCQEMVDAITKAKIIIKGERTTIRKIICKEFWTLVTSVVILVIKLEVEK